MCKRYVKQKGTYYVYYMLDAYKSIHNVGMFSYGSDYIYFLHILYYILHILY